MATHESDERALFEAEGTALYVEIVTSSGLEASEPRLQEGGDLHDALLLLHKMGLIRLTEDAEHWEAEDPSMVQSQVVAPLSTEGARLLSESAHWASAFNAVTQAWRRAPTTTSGGPFTYLHDTAIEPYLAGLVADCEEEMLTAQPQELRDTGRLPMIVLRDTALLERGAKVRTLYQHSARRSSVTRQYVTAMTERGGEVRTLDEFFNRMIVFDRRVAVIPSRDTVRVALVVREPSVVAYLVDVFERAWARARQFTSHESLDDARHCRASSGR